MTNELTSVDKTLICGLLVLLVAVFMLALMVWSLWREVKLTRRTQSLMHKNNVLVRQRLDILESGARDHANIRQLSQHRR